MGWVIEFAIETLDLVAGDLIRAIYKRYGFWGAVMAIIGSIVLIGLLVAILLSV